MAMILRVAQSHPLYFGCGFSCLKTSASDLLVQKFIEKRENIDWRRNSAFAMFGFGYLGIVQYSLYVPIFSRIFPRGVEFAAKTVREKMRDGKGQMTVLAQVFVDQCIHHPFMYFPAFYLTKEFVSNRASGSDYAGALATWQANFWPDLYALWQIWVPCTLLNFAFSPLWMRIPVVASTSLVWTMILSGMRGSEQATLPTKTDVELVAAGTDIVLEPEEIESGDIVIGGHVDARAMEIMARGLARRFSQAPPPEPTASLQDVPTHMCVTASGADRVGLVNAITRWVYDCGGNITGSKMLRMHDEFTIVMHVTTPSATAATALRSDLLGAKPRPRALESISIRARELGTHQQAALDSKRELRIRLTGEDKPGIVFELSALLSSLGYNIDELATDTVPVASDDGTTKPWFLLEGYATAPGECVDPKELNAKLDGLRQKLGVTIDTDWTGR